MWAPIAPAVGYEAVVVANVTAAGWAVQCAGEGCDTESWCWYDILGTALHDPEDPQSGYDITSMRLKYSSCSSGYAGCCKPVLGMNLGGYAGDPTYVAYCDYKAGCDNNNQGCSYVKLGNPVWQSVNNTILGAVVVFYELVTEDCELVLGACCWQWGGCDDDIAEFDCVGVWHSNEECANVTCTTQA